MSIYVHESTRTKLFLIRDLKLSSKIDLIIVLTQTRFDYITNECELNIELFTELDSFIEMALSYEVIKS